MTDLDSVNRGIVAIAFWGKRADTPVPLADKFVRQVDALAAIDNVFELWTCGARRPRTFESVRERFTDQVEDSIVRDDFGEPDPIFGYSVGAVTRKKDSCFALRANVGATYTSEFSQNSVFLDSLSAETSSLLSATYPVMSAALRSFVEIWNPDYGLVYPLALRHLFRSDKSVFHEAWIHYLSAPLAKRIEPPRDILVETLSDGGILMSATTDTFDVDNPAHLAGARAIEAAIRLLNDIPASEYAAG